MTLAHDSAVDAQTVRQAMRVSGNEYSLALALARDGAVPGKGMKPVQQWRVPLCAVTLCAAIERVGPFQLNAVVADRPGLPGADVADFTDRVVIPPLTWYWIGDRLTELVSSRRRQGVENCQAAVAAAAARVGHDRVEDPARNVVVISAKARAGGAAALDDLDAGGR
jgi:hypothetical protein